MAAETGLPLPTRRGWEMRALFGLTVLGWIFFHMGFWSDSWWYTINKKNTFRSAGPFIFCFDGYVYPYDYRGRYYYGCRYVWGKYFRWMFPFLSPDWLIAVQVFIGFANFFNFLNFVIVLTLFTRPYNLLQRYKRLRVVFFSKIAEIICLTIACVVFAAKSASDWKWMPMRMDNLLGWGFAMATMSGSIALISMVPTTMVTFKFHQYFEKIKREMEFKPVPTYDMSVVQPQLPPEQQPLKAPPSFDEVSEDSPFDNDRKNH